jgi:tetratricopeptide (TPR) repeat protein
MSAPVPAPVDFKYRAFLSYAHADAKWAKWLHGQLEAFRIDHDLAGRETPLGPVPKTLRPIFRDRDDFTGGHSLTDATIVALDAAAALIVLCSSVAATRPTVNEEVRLFRSRHPDRPVIPVIIDGTYPHHFPPALRFELAADGSISERPVTILGPDLRETADGKALGLAKVIAGLTGVSPDDIFRRAERERRRKGRVRNAVIGVLALLAVAATGSAAYAWQQLKTNEEFLDATLAQFTGLVDTAVTSAEAYAPLTFTHSILRNAEGILEAVTKYGRDAPKIQYRKATMLAAFSDNYRDIGRTETAKGRLDEAQQIMTELVRAEPARTDYLFVKAQLHGKAGALLSILGDAVGSQREYRARHEIISRLAPTDPGNVDWQLELALSRTSLVDMLSMRDDTAATLQGYQEGLALIERLATADPANVKLQGRLSTALTNIGFALWQQGKLEGARETLDRAVAVDEVLTAANPNNAGMQRNLAKSRAVLATIQNMLGSRAEALRNAESSTAIYQNLTARDPDNASWRVDFAIGNMLVVILKAKTDKSESGLALARRARDSVSTLVASDSANVTLRQQLAVFDLQLGELLADAGKQEAALEVYQFARDSVQRIFGQDSASGMSHMLLVLLHGKVGDTLAKTNEPAKALESYRSAVALAGKLVQSDKSNALFQVVWADALKNKGNALLSADQLDDALEAFQTELAARQDVVAFNPDNIDWQTGVFDARNRVAGALDKQDKSAAAIDAYRQTMADGERLLARFPDNSQIVSSVFVAAGTACVSEVQKADFVNAAVDCERALELQRIRVRLDPNNAANSKLLHDLEKLVPGLQLKAANATGRYADALAAQERIVAQVEAEEVKTKGQPGKDTADELATLAWQALLAGAPAKALGACDKSLALQPGDLAAELNRAHALMYVGRVEEARAIHVAHKDDVFADSNKPWPQVVAEDFEELRKAGRAHPQMAEIEAAFGPAPKHPG